MLKIQNDTIVKILWKKIREESITAEEQKILDEWRSASAHNQSLFNEVMEEEQWNNDLKLLLDRDEKALFDQILPEIQGGRVVKMNKSWIRYAAAAVVILAAGTYYFKSGPVQEKPQIAAQKKTDVRQHDKAFLALSDGSTIYLDAASNGVLARDGASKINKLTDGELVYDAADPANSNQLPLTVNILSTPRGGRYKVTLQDGSKVWLNAASTLRFPSSFNGKERVVELSGEAYFEIASSPSGHARIPFLVKANGMNVDVLGTHFNVMAYSDEPVMATSLMQGSVKVLQGADEHLLKPGQQALVTNELASPGGPRPMRIVEGQNEQATGWRKGFLQFKSADLASVMRQISRSYKIDVVYKGQSATTFSGVIDLKTDIREVVRALQMNDLNVKLDGNKIFVL